MVFKFVEMLYFMYGDGYREQIEEFAESVMYEAYEDGTDPSQDDLFIKWASFIQESEHFETTL